MAIPHIHSGPVYLILASNKKYDSHKGCEFTYFPLALVQSYLILLKDILKNIFDLQKWGEKYTNCGL